jgi:hypothetical protein
MAGAAPAHADAPTTGGCQAFGGNVAALAQPLGAEFGATASQLGPQAIPDDRRVPSKVRYAPERAFCFRVAQLPSSLDLSSRARLCGSKLGGRRAAVGAGGETHLVPASILRAVQAQVGVR